MGVPFTVTAHLQQGVSLDPRIGIALDGLLASETRNRARARLQQQTGQPVPGSVLDGGLHRDVPAHVALPLDICGDRDSDPDWHWMATAGTPVDHNHTIVSHATGHDPDVHHQYSRVNERIATQVAFNLPTALPPASGRYRMKRIPVVTHAAAMVTWQAVGDPDAVFDLLPPIASIGHRRHSGEGTVTRWTVTTHDPHVVTPTLHAHLRPDGSLARPTTRRCLDLTQHTADTNTTGGVRPPYWHPSTQHPVAMPPPL